LVLLATALLVVAAVHFMKLLDRIACMGQLVARWWSSGAIIWLPTRALCANHVGC
jgi:hypothetical protein